MGFTEVGCKGVYRGRLQMGFTEVGYKGVYRGGL